MSWKDTLDALKVACIDETLFDWVFEPINQGSLVMKRRN